MLVALTLTSLCLSGTALADSFELLVAAADVAAHQSTFAAYGEEGYLGMMLVDGSPTREEGATLVVRFLPAGEDTASWLEGVTVDAGGRMLSVVHREGRRIRTMTVTEAGIEDVVTEGRDGPALSSALQPADGPLSSPWLVGLGLVHAQPRSGDVWQGFLVDGMVRPVSLATLTSLGRSSVGKGRAAQVAQLQPDDGPVRTFVYDRETLSAFMRPQVGVQWVAAPRDQIEQTHDKTLD